MGWLRATEIKFVPFFTESSAKMGAPEVASKSKILIRRSEIVRVTESEFGTQITLRNGQLILVQESLDDLAQELALGD